jgi:hypothetical protein
MKKAGEAALRAAATVHGCGSASIRERDLARIGFSGGDRDPPRELSKWGAARELQPEEDGDEWQYAHRGFRVGGLPRAYRVASFRPAVGECRQWREVPSI